MDFAKFSDDVKGKFRRGDDNAAYAFYPFDQGVLAKLANMKTEGFCEQACITFVEGRFFNPRLGYREIFGEYIQHDDKRDELVKTLQLLQDLKEKYKLDAIGITALRRDKPGNATSAKFMGKEEHPFRLNSIADLIEEIFRKMAVYHVRMRPADGSEGHSIAFDTRGPVIMFDPNTGWWEVRNNPTAGGYFKGWFPKYYTEHGYRTSFHNGNRSFTRYT